ncbi:glycosyltransferase family 2 protein [Candidatus Saccharibacteria bacterium]|nr:glycosyltransferase family 2 protein [Candidatus Saccharibacteria bacterium]
MKDDNPKESDLISVIVPIYNVKKYLRRCVKGILAQTYKNLEIILIDDGSTDGSAKLCDELFKQDRRVVVFHKENGGISSARNYGVRAANGKYICFVDPDDTVDEDYVETLHDTIVKYKVKLAICSHRVLYAGHKTAVDMGTEESGRIDSKTIIKRLLYADGIDTSLWAKMFTRDILMKHPCPEGREFEDAAITYLCFDSVKYIGINLVAKYTYCVRRMSIAQKPFEKSKMDLITATQEMHDYIIEKYPKLRLGAERRLMYAYLSTLRQIAIAPVTADSVECLPVVWQYIKAHKGAVLRDTNIPERDRKALVSTNFGYGFFRFSLKMYEKFRHVLT